MNLRQVRKRGCGVLLEDRFPGARDPTSTRPLMCNPHVDIIDQPDAVNHHRTESSAVDLFYVFNLKSTRLQFRPDRLGIGSFT